MNFVGKILKGIAYVITTLIFVPIFIGANIVGILQKLLSYINLKCKCVKGNNKNLVRKKLYSQINKILDEEKEIYLCRDYWIKVEEYSSYVTLKYLFTGDKKTFKYIDKYDKYLYNYYDFNSHKSNFTTEWIDEIKKFQDSKILIEETFIKDYFDDSKSKKVLKISQR